MFVLVVGASGATGRLLVEQLLEQGETVKAIVRSTKSDAGLEAHVDNQRRSMEKVARANASYL